MVFQPAILALLLADAVTLLLLLPASRFAVAILRHWDLHSGSARQLELERRTYLISTIVALACGVQGLALLLMVFNADHMAPLFSGAMCAVGSFNAAPFGFESLHLRMGLFFVAAAWLLLNHLDNQAPDYPLIRTRYALLLLIPPLTALAATAQGAWFLGLRAEVITSCCGSLFGGDAPTLAADLAGWPPRPMMAALALALGGAVGSGLYHRLTGRGLPLFALLGGVALPVTLAAVVSFVSLYVYEHPHHHCPFCLLKAEYGYLGYGLYPPLFIATALALGLGLTYPFARRGSARTVLAGASPRLAGVAVLLYLWVGLVIVWAVGSSNLKLLE